MELVLTFGALRPSDSLNDDVTTATMATMVLDIRLIVWNISALSSPQIRVRNRKLFSNFSTETYVVGTQKNRLNETFF